jgi:hypothetical protein
MIDASRWLKAVEAQLNAEDRTILRLVCGEGFWPSEAVRAAAGHSHYDKAVVRASTRRWTIWWKQSAMRRNGGCEGVRFPPTDALHNPRISAEQVLRKQASSRPVRL